MSDGPDDGELSHWESGFLMVTESGAVELLNAQQSGRVEVLSGHLRETASGRCELALRSLAHAHDERGVETPRVLAFERDTLEYEVQMATDQVVARQVHLRAQLVRARTRLEL